MIDTIQFYKKLKLQFKRNKLGQKMNETTIF